jgi:hypothetical protein
LVIIRALEKGGGVKVIMIEKFYYGFWLPFTINKKRILILAIASYIALC